MSLIPGPDLDCLPPRGEKQGMFRLVRQLSTFVAYLTRRLGSGPTVEAVVRCTDRCVCG